MISVYTVIWLCKHLIISASMATVAQGRERVCAIRGIEIRTSWNTVLSRIGWSAVALWERVVLKIVVPVYITCKFSKSPSREHCKKKRALLTHLELPQSQLQMLGLHYNGMCASLQCIYSQSLCCQLAQMTVTALLIFYSLKWVATTSRDLLTVSKRSRT